jgi:hypothetical protein
VTSQTGRKTDTNLLDSIPPAQTVCDGKGATVTVLEVQPTRTELDVDYITYETEATVWVGYVSFPASLALVDSCRGTYCIKPTLTAF